MITGINTLSPVREVIRTRDEKKIGATIYRPAREYDKLVIIGPSALETQACYAPLATYLAEQGVLSITFDYRGVGASVFKTKGKNAVSLHHWGNFDLDAVLRYAKNTFPGKEIIFIAHGVSGEIVGLAAASQYINRMVLVNSVLSCSRLWPLKDRVRLFVLRRFSPFFTRILQFITGNASFTALPPGVYREWRNWCANTNGLFDAFPDSNYRKLQVPILVYSFSDDWHSPAKAVSALLRHFDAAAITWFHGMPRDFDIRRAGHSGFFCPAYKTLFWQPLLYWFDDQRPPGQNKGTVKMLPGYPVE